MIQNVLSGWDHSRPLGSLNRADLRKLADAAICGWILQRAEMARCGDKEIRDELISCAVFVDETSDASPGREQARTSAPIATVSPR
jgi:hypothetical protein